MKKLSILTILIICWACKKDEKQNVLYNQLINYRDDLKTSIKSQQNYFSENPYENKLYQKVYDSLNEINLECEKSFENLRYNDKNKLLNLRDSFNSKNNLDIKFDNYSNNQNIPDSIFNKLIETDFLRMRKKFIEKYMYIKGDSFE